MLKGKTIGFLGSGNMAEALIKGFINTGKVPSTSIAASDAVNSRLEFFYSP